MVSVPVPSLSGQGLSPGWGTLCCVFRQVALLSQCLSPTICTNGYWQIKCWGNAAVD